MTAASHPHGTAGQRQTLLTAPNSTLVSLERMAAAGLRLAVAESLTGGLLADAFVSIPGASRVFSGAVVAYDTALKHSLLRVDDEVLRLRGPVDGEVAKQMARGVRAACAVPCGDGESWLGSHLGLATTGVAGPDPDPQTGQPAGTVWIGVSSARGERSVRLELSGDRPSIRASAVRAAMLELAVELDALLGSLQPAPRNLSQLDAGSGNLQEYSG